jgi:agmatinase
MPTTKIMLNVDLGVAGIVKKIRETVGDRPVYLSIDIDSIDPA